LALRYWSPHCRSAFSADCTLVPVEGGPHNIAWTHPDEVNSALLEFITAKVPVTA
jgi:pimeloyl-ACP methyl ester carboxylesterase